MEEEGEEEEIEGDEGSDSMRCKVNSGDDCRKGRREGTVSVEAGEEEGKDILFIRKRPLDVSGATGGVERERDDKDAQGGTPTTSMLA